jgi:GT2 family glycosyltransferase
MLQSGAPAPAVCVVVLNWNRWMDTVQCLDSLANLAYENVRVLVVDNFSSDRSVERILASHPETEILQTGANLGYGGGNNLGIKHSLASDAQYVWLLNNDSDVPHDCLRALVQVMEGCPQIGILAPAVCDTATRQLEPEREFPPYVKRRYSQTQPALSTCDGELAIQVVDYVSGSCMLIRRAALVDLGGFDLRYFHFYEDVDLCWRAWSLGWPVARTWSCTVQHRTGSSTSGLPAFVSYYSLRNRLLFSAQAVGSTVPNLMLRPRIARLCLRSLFGVRGFLEPQRKLATVWALVDALRHRSGRNLKY